MKKLLVALTLVISTVCLTLAQVVIDGPTPAWWTPIGLALPAIVMAVVCFDRRLAIGHYVLSTAIATLGIYWIAIGISGYAAILLEGTQQESRSAERSAPACQLPGTESTTLSAKSWVSPLAHCLL